MATLPQMKSFLTRASKKSDASEGLKRIANALKNFRQLDKGDQKDLNDLVRSAYAKLKSKPKATSTPKKATPKKTDSFATDLDKFKKKVGKVIFRRATSGTDIVKDAKRPALKSGKRIVRKQGYTSNQYGTFENKVGTPYWESRSNRMDVNQPSQRARVKLADGGELANAKNKKIMEAYRMIVSDLRNQSYPRMSPSLAFKKASEYMLFEYTKEELMEAIKSDKQIEMFGMEKTWLNALKKAKNPSKMAQGGKVSNIDDEVATQELKEEVKSKMKKGDAVIHFAFTDYGGDFIDKVAIEYFEEKYPKNIVVENTAFFGKNAFVFGKPAEEWIEASEDYILGFEDFESFYYEKINEAEQEGFEYYLGDLERDGYEFDMGEVLSWLIENKSGYYNVTTQGLDFSYGDITDELLEDGLIRKEEFAKGGKVDNDYSTFKYYKVPNENFYAIQECDINGENCGVIRHKKTEKDAIEEIQRLTDEQGFRRNMNARKRIRSNEDTYPKGTEFAKGGKVGKSYTYGNEGYSYTNNFGVDQADFIKLVDVYHNTNPLEQMDRIVERLTYREFANKYGEEKLDDVMNYVHETHESHEGRYAKGGKLSSRAKYIPNRNIEEVEVNQNGKTRFIDGADILDGFYVKKKGKFAEGGELDEAKIYVADLMEYNNGKLVGKWLNLSDYSSGSEVLEAIQEFLDEQTKKDKYGEVHEEYAIHDYEGFPRSFYSEYMGEGDFDNLYEIMRIADSSNLPVDVLMEAMSDLGYEDNAERVAEAYYSSIPASMGNEFRDFAYEYIDSIGSITDAVSNPEYYFDYERFGRELRWDYTEEELEEMGYNDLSDEELGEQVADEQGGVENLGEKTIEMYFDYDKFGRDLEYDFIAVRGKDGDYYFFNRNFAKGGKVKIKNFRKIESKGKTPKVPQEKWKVMVVNPYAKKDESVYFNVSAKNKEEAQKFAKSLYSKKYNVPTTKLLIETALPYSHLNRFQLKNQYEGKTPQQIWDVMALRQREHFLHDHQNVCEVNEKEIEELIWLNWEELNVSPMKNNVVQAFTEHINKGQYAKGGEIDGFYRLKKKYEVGGVVERYDNPLFNQGMQGELSGFGTSSPMSVFANGGTTDPQKFNQDNLMAEGGKMSIIEQILKKYNVQEDKTDETRDWLKKEWEGKNIDDYVMYSDKYGKGGKTASIGGSGIITDKNSMFVGKMALITGDLGNMYEVRVGERTTIVKKNGINIIANEDSYYAKGGEVDKKKYKFQITEYKDENAVINDEPTISDYEGTKEKVIDFQYQRMQRGYCVYFNITIVADSNNKGWFYESEDLDDLIDEIENSDDDNNDFEYTDYEKIMKAYGYAKGGEVDKDYVFVGNTMMNGEYKPVYKKDNKYYLKYYNPTKYNFLADEKDIKNYRIGRATDTYAKGGEVGNKYYASIITHNQNVEPYINIKPQTIITNTKEEMVEKLNKLYKKTFSQNYSPYEITDLDEKYAINGTYISDDWSYVTNNYERFKEIHKIHIKDFNETSNKKQTYAKGGEVEITNSTIDRGGLGNVQDSILAKGGLLKKVESFGKKAMKKAKPVAKKIVRKTKKYSAVALKKAKIGFDALAEKVAKSYEGKKVKPKYQGEYGKTYSKAEAKEVGEKVSAKVYRQQLGKRKITRKLRNKTK